MTHGGVDLYNMCVDGAAWRMADALVALEHRVEQQRRISWSARAAATGFDGVRLMMARSQLRRSGLAGDQWPRVSQILHAAGHAEADRRAADDPRLPGPTPRLGKESRGDVR